jgi:hypothetical protein
MEKLVDRSEGEVAGARYVEIYCIFAVFDKKSFLRKFCWELEDSHLRKLMGFAQFFSIF